MITSEHIGMGVVICRNVLDIDPDFFAEYCGWLTGQSEQTFKFEKDHAVNQTGFKFSIEDIGMAPQRFLDTRGRNRNEEVPQKYLDFVDSCEDALYLALVEYCKIFPDAATTAWWRPQGHVAVYDAGQNIGPHCDDQVPFEWGEAPPNQVSMHNSTSINLYLNNCGTDYTGGEINFPHAGQAFAPEAGSVAIYPSSYVGRHEVYPVESGRRVAFLSMACYGVDTSNNEVVGQEGPRIWMPDLITDSQERSMDGRRS